MQPSHVAWTLCIVPIVAAHGAYLIALNAGTAEACIPYIYGCTSISRAARVGDALFFFRGLMMPCAALLVFFWWLQKTWLDRLLPSAHRKHLCVFMSGAIGALFLLLYANYLGSTGEMYNLMRRFGVTFYFALTAMAQLISLHTLTRTDIDLAPPIRRLVKGQLVLVTLQWFVGIGHVIAKSLSQSEDLQNWLENAIEWHFALYMTLFFGFSARIWQRQQYRWRTETLRDS
jgi:hypothetical protein